MKYNLIKVNGVIKYKQNQEIHPVPKIPVNAGYIKEGWKSQPIFDFENAQALEFGNPQAIKGESRIIIDKEESEVIIENYNAEDYIGFSYEILSRKIIDVEAVAQVGTALIPAVGIEGEVGYQAEIPASVDYVPAIEEVSHLEYFYILPKIEHEEWYCEANYTIEVEDTESNAYKLANYAKLRASEYPDMKEYLDAQVKKESGNDALIAQGIAQEAKYIADCLLTKAKYPKI